MSGNADVLRRLVELVERWAGIDLARGGKTDTLDKLVEVRARQTGAASMAAYVDSLTAPTHPEVTHLVNAVTVNHTWFYRDAEQLEVVAQLIRERKIAGSRARVDIWVPGCASGEDVYSLAMLARRLGREAFVLGTDINTEVLAHAVRGRYGEWSAREVPAESRIYLQSVAGSLEVAPLLREQVKFEYHNLMEPPPQPPGGVGWHVILCRNVLIYFTREKTEATIQRLGQTLSVDGRLLLGSSEILQAPPPGLANERLGNRFALRRSSGETYRPAPPGPPAPSYGREERNRVSSPSASATSVSGPDRVQTHVASVISLGNARLEAGETSEALGFYAKALEMDPLNAEARFFTGVAYHLTGDPSAASQALRGALVLAPDLWPASFYLALSYDKLGRPADAEREYRQVVNGEGQPPKLSSRSALVGDLTAFRRDVVRISRSRSGAGSPPTPRGNRP